MLLVVPFVGVGCALQGVVLEEPHLLAIAQPRLPVAESVDHPVDDLLLAITRSVEYYERLPEQATFSYGDITYSKQEMLQSMQLFSQICQEWCHSQQFSEILNQNFVWFETRNADGEAFFTGYYEPTLQGSSTPTEQLSAPAYGVPPDLVRIDFGKFLPEQTRIGSGRLIGQWLVPYYSRREITEQQSLLPNTEVMAYVDPTDLFFLQIQGSGMVELPNGEKIRLNYAASNGHPYRSIGTFLVQRGYMELEDVSMDSIRQFLDENPQLRQEILMENPSYTFFYQPQDGPLGNIEVPLTPERSLAVDDYLFPRGGLAYIETKVPDANDPRGIDYKRFMVVQDTGGVIKGAGRADIFFGNGERAKYLAGHMKNVGRLFFLVAKKEALQRFQNASESLNIGNTINNTINDGLGGMGK